MAWPKRIGPVDTTPWITNFHHHRDTLDKSKAIYNGAKICLIKKLAKANWINGRLAKENWCFDTPVAAQNCWSENNFHHHHNTLDKRAKKTNPKKTCKIKNLWPELNSNFILQKFKDECYVFKTSPSLLEDYKLQNDHHRLNFQKCKSTNHEETNDWPLSFINFL